MHDETVIPDEIIAELHQAFANRLLKGTRCGAQQVDMSDYKGITYFIGSLPLGHENVPLIVGTLANPNTSFVAAHSTAAALIGATGFEAQGCSLGKEWLARTSIPTPGPGKATYTMAKAGAVRVLLLPEGWSRTLAPILATQRNRSGDNTWPSEFWEALVSSAKTYDPIEGTFAE